MSFVKDHVLKRMNKQVLTRADQNNFMRQLQNN